MTLRTRLLVGDDGRATFNCPGCHEEHVVRVTGAGAWDYDNNHWRPTLKPSVLITGTYWLTDAEHRRVMKGENITPRKKRCHSYIEGGMIRFLDDCTHGLAGQTVQLPAYD